MLIMNPIFSDGKEYISAIRASKKIGYASDYIGQLCRAKKIPGKLVGRTWYVDFESLLSHKQNRQQGKGKNKNYKENFFQTVTENPAEIFTPKLPERFSFIYEKDSGPRLPELSKSVKYREPVLTSKLLKEVISMSLAVV